MTIDHVEPLVDSAIASLRADLNTQIDAINAEGGSSVVLEHVAAGAYKPGGLAQPSTEFPFVEVSASDASYAEATIRQAAWNRAQATMIVALWCRDVDDELLYRATLRYGRALLSVLLKADAFGAKVYVDNARVMYRRVQPNDASEIDACVLIVLTVVGDEATP